MFMPVTAATTNTSLQDADDVLDYIVELSSASDIRALDRIFLDAVCACMPLDYLLLCVFSTRGYITRIKRYWDPAGNTYQTCWQQEPLSDEQSALIQQAKQVSEGAVKAVGQGRQLAAFNSHNDGGDTVNLLIQYANSVTYDRLIALRALRQVFFNFRAFIDASQRDTLTGLLNRRYFDDCIHRALDVIEEEKSPSTVDALRRSTDTRPSRQWLAILDIDHFKKFNDSYGHLYGDEILLLFSRIMEQTFRESDLLFRFGGEEFVVIMESANPDDAMAALERFRRAVQDYPFPQGEQVTVSCGAIEAVGRNSASDLLGKADEALYYAKNHGRNRTVTYEQLLASGELSDAVRIEGEMELF